jgi:hypothetical protein
LINIFILFLIETYSASNECGGPLFPGAFYLHEIDSELRRFYARNENKE